MSEFGQLMVSVSGIRGVVGKGLTPEVALAYASAFATRLGGGRVILSRDSRPHGEMLRHAVLAGLTASGCTVFDLGIAPTPTCGWVIPGCSASGGIQITASHNPAEWNGLKLFCADGSVLGVEAGGEVQRIFESRAFNRESFQRAMVIPHPDATREHVRHVLKLVNVSAVRARKPRVLLDANGGAGGPMGIDLLSALGCDLVPIRCEPDGGFIHPPEPIPEHLTDVARCVAAERDDIGFVLDPDADRLALIDETGRCIGEELTLVLAVRYRLGQEVGPVVVNMSTSRASEDVAKMFGASFQRTAVGEANVVAGMRQANAVIGGEGNGGVIDPRVGWVRDPFIGMGLILSLMAETGKRLSELVAEVPVYEIVKTKFDLDPSRLERVYRALVKRWPDAKADRTDGLRLDWADRWLHVRPSNTEPIVRAIAEAPDRASAERLCAEAGAVIGS